MTEDTRQAAGFVLFREARGQREYLLLKNARHGTWGFPKGHREPAEDDLSCARRELAEETGLVEIEILPGFDHRERYCLPGRTTIKTVRYFLARLVTGQPILSEEHESGDFMPLEMALKKLQHQSARDLIQAADTVASEASRP